MPRPTIAFLSPSESDRAEAARALEEAAAIPLAVEEADPMPPHAAGLLLVGDGGFDPTAARVPPALSEALEARLPVLGIEWGMQVLSAAHGGKAPSSCEGHAAPAPGHRVFLTMGGKVSSIIGGAGVVGVASRHRSGLPEGRRGKGLMSSAFAVEDGIVEAVELPGDRWVIGVQWPVHLPGLPSGFENLLPAFVERAAARQPA